MCFVLVAIIAAIAASTAIETCKRPGCFSIRPSEQPYRKTFSAFQRFCEYIEDSESAFQEFEPRPEAVFTSQQPAQEPGQGGIVSNFFLGWYDTPTEMHVSEVADRFESPTETFHVWKIIHKHAAVVRREKKDETFRFAGTVLTPAVRYWRNNFARIPAGLMRIVTAEEWPHHPLVREFAILKIVYPYRIGPKPIYLSPAAAAGTSNAGVPVKTRFIVTRVPGASIEALIAGEGKMKADKALRLVRKVAESMESMHRLGISHGRIDETNVFLTDSNSVTEGVLLTGFGHATMDPNGLHRGPTLRDINAIFKLLVRMNGVFETMVEKCALGKGDFQSHVCALYRATMLLRTVDEIDYEAIRASIDAALTTAAMA